MRRVGTKCEWILTARSVDDSITSGDALVSLCHPIALFTRGIGPVLACMGIKRLKGERRFRMLAETVLTSLYGCAHYFSR